MHQIQVPMASVIPATTIQPALLSTLSRILKLGDVVLDERGAHTKELRNVTVSIDKPWVWNLDNLNWAGIWLRPKWCDPVFMKAYEQQAEARSRGTHPYVYGSELRAHPTLAYQGDDNDGFRVHEHGHQIDQISEYLVPKLVENIRSRRAVGFTWNVAEFSDLHAQEVPCLDMIQAQIRPDENKTERLHLTGILRSNEMYSAWAADVAFLFVHQQEIAERINRSKKYKGTSIAAGSLTTVSNSAHIYQENWRDAEQLCRNMGWLRSTTHQ